MTERQTTGQQSLPARLPQATTTLLVVTSAQSWYLHAEDGLEHEQFLA